MSEAATKAATKAADGDGEFYRVVDESGELMGQFPSSRIARDFARRTIEAGKARTLVVEWSNNGRRGELSITRKSVQAAGQRALDAKRRIGVDARRRANLISGVAAAMVLVFTLLHVAVTYVEAGGGPWYP
ncbi:hypothetical protein N825_04045 [Skermanella stibiiresistens SB22]|uniref:Uncharacterized protein n=1 Tax=Skermanella stibiiresistens SB22 TaxID=1385369 RepID=W9H130_9PROT|nr:hypothetical protein [Skermanella stibiiresistens]EWY39885.1 hypothetical protein N825_04045 [Skermanella stibiiresistens SB22]